MSLFAATLIPGLVLIVLGLPLLRSGAGRGLKAFPRSPAATWVFFGGGAIWFLSNVWHLSSADFGDYRTPIFIAFAIIAALAFKCVPDFLAVRGVCILALLSAMPLLDAAYMEYEHPRRLFLVSLVYLCIGLGIWLGAQPWRMRDFIEWLLVRPARLRAFGGLLTAYGLLLCALAFTY